ncbi:hypothetical protein MOV08_05300 [Streptomyces yunnanensis]|uniref:CHAP domain-containing protein n=1 Tax=Streptomyces yunnanensis TaxID=156453 RepID=A0ABY8A501_9ACTN|nr:hypothetical protein [Streptomyces yunnanensis]WEB38777.1 hypothetical protein MOV08_05300 [Streptomyces yunnanensis]
MIDKAKSYVGYREGAGNANRFSKEMGRPAESWCADFVSAVAVESGNGDVFPNSASCGVSQDWFRKRGRLSDYPAIGSQVFYGDSSSSYGPGGSHTEVVYAYDKDRVYTIGGNTNNDGSSNGNGVYLRSPSRKSAWTHSYGYPDYPEGITCADPAWKGKPNVSYFGQEASAVDIRKHSEPTPGKVTINGAVYGPGAEGDHIQYMADCLWKAGYWKGPKDAHAWGGGHTESVRAYQIAIGDADSADGVPGLKQLTRLETEHGQGLWPVQKPTPPKPDPTPKPDGNTVPKTVWLSNPSPSKVKANTWTTVDVTGKGDGTVIHSNGDCKFSSNVKLAFADVPAGATVQGRFLKFTGAGDSDGGYAVVERVATGDYSFVDFSAMGHMNAGRHLVCQVAVFGKDDQEFTISGRTAEALYWD